MTQLRIDAMLGRSTSCPRPPREPPSRPGLSSSSASTPPRLAKDSPKRAANRSLAEENGSYIKHGYDLPSGRVDLAPLVSASKLKTQSYTAEDTGRILSLQRAKPTNTTTTSYEVSAESSMAAAQRLAAGPAASSAPASAGAVCVLNFASARHAGGGYLSGSKAQEEDLCRVSGLYSTLQCAPDFYAAHTKLKDARYSHRMVYSAAVPVFRNAIPPSATSAAASAATGLASSAPYALMPPYAVDFLTAPAPNMTAVAKNQPATVGSVPGILKERAGRILALALERGVTVLVLGAWGCGVFGNDLRTVLECFRFWLEGELRGRFERVVWAMNDAKGADRAGQAFPNATRV